jgi:hypothetical protein
MNLERYESSNQRRRLPGRTEPCGSQTGLPTWGMFLFGIPFLGAGVVVTLIGLKVIPVNPSSVHAPYWVLTVFGAVFALGGLMFWGMARKQYVSTHRRREAVRRYRDEPALADYGWDPRGFEAPRWKRAVTSVFRAGFLALFLSIFNWCAFYANGPWMAKAIVILFDLFLVAVSFGAGVSVVRALKFGGSRIEFAHFPCRLSEPVVVRWQPATGIVRVNRGSFTLRCVEEWFERHGSGKNQPAQLVHEEISSGTWHLDEGRAFEPGKWVELRFELSADAPSTQLSAVRPVFWELEVKLDLPGLDFAEIYLVPIYGQR